MKNLKSRTFEREAHSLDLLQLDPELDVENYLVSRSHLVADEPEDIALLDSATIHTILKNPKYFNFGDIHKSPAWKSCVLTIIFGKRNLRFREDQVKLMLPGGFPLNICQAMFAPLVLRSLLSYKDLRA